MSEMEERVAKAIWETRRRLAMDIHGIELEEWGDGSIPRANHVFEEAHAAIEAMRDPTEEMNVRYLSDQNEEFLDIYRSMIDAALDTPSQITPNQSRS